MNRKRWKVAASVALVLILAFPFSAEGKATPNKVYPWENHRVVGSGGKTPVGELIYNLVWNEPHLLEGTVEHKIALPPRFPLAAKSPCTWRFTEDFFQICVTMQVPLGNQNYELVRVDDTKTYKGVWGVGCPMGAWEQRWEMSLTIYPDRMEGSGGGQELLFKITPPLAEREVPPQFRFIFEEDAHEGAKT
jgi:hypothetical protein